LPHGALHDFGGAGDDHPRGRARAGLSDSGTASWICGAFFLNSLSSIAFALLYRQPRVFLWTILGAVLLGSALGHLIFAKVIGADHAATSSGSRARGRSSR